MANIYEQMFPSDTGGDQEAPPPSENIYDKFFPRAQAAEPRAEPQVAERKSNIYEQLFPKQEPPPEEKPPVQLQEPIPEARTGLWRPVQQQQQPEQPKEPEAEDALMSGARALGHAVLPGAAFLPGMEAGAAIGSAVLPGVGTVAGGLIGGLATSALASKAQESGLSAMGFDDSHQQAINAQTHPYATFAGEMAGAAASFGAGATRPAVRAFGALAGSGLEALQEKMRGEDLDPARLAMGAGA